MDELKTTFTERQNSSWVYNVLQCNITFHKVHKALNCVIKAMDYESEDDISKLHRAKHCTIYRVLVNAIELLQ